MIPPPNQSHIHGPNCSHSHQHRPQRDFIPMQIPRVFWVFSCLNGQFFQRMFLQLPLMIQFYQIYLMMKGMVCQQPKDFYFQGVSSCLHNVPYALLRQILGGFSIPFLLINYFGITYVFQYQIPDLDSKYTVDFLLKCSLVSTFILYVAFFLVDPGFLNTKEDKAEMQEIVQKRPEIAHPRNFCAFCSQPRIARSWHCDFCGFCVAKWEKHSFIFNRCIGAGNQLLYLCFTFSYTILIAICFLCFFMKKSTYHNHSIWGTLMFFSLLINLWSFFQESLIQCFCVFYNITTYEIQNFRRFNYLWKNKHGEFFNPFDKGPFHNLRESIESLVPSPPQISKPADLEINQDMPINNPDTIINWRKAKFYTVLDIANSPLKDLLIEEMKKLNGATSNMANKENPFSEPFPKGRNLGMNQGIDKKEEETEALVIKNEEEKINPFTN